MYLDTVEASCQRVSRPLRMLRDDAGDLRCFKRAWCGDLLEAVCREGFCVRPNGGRRDRQGTAGLEGGMRDASDMPELQHYAAATGMDCTGHAFPACDLLGAVDTRRADIALAFGRDLGCFRDDKSGAGPLGIIQRAQRGGHVAGVRAASGQGRHDNTVRQRERSYFDGGEEIPRGLSGEVLHETILLRREDVNGTTPPIAVTQPLRVRSNRDGAGLPPYAAKASPLTAAKGTSIIPVLNQYKCIGCSPGKHPDIGTMAPGSDDDSRDSAHGRCLCSSVWPSGRPRRYERQDRRRAH